MEFRFEYHDDLHCVELADGEHLLGRAPDAALHFASRRVSSRHATLRVEGDRLFLRDLNSTNGTAVDGEPLLPDRGEVEVAAGTCFAVADIEVSWGAAQPELSDEPEVTGAARRTLPADEEEPLTQLSYQLDQGYRQSARIRITEVLSDLFELISTEESSEDLATRTCEFVHRCLKADSVVLLEDQGEGTSLAPLGSWTASGTPTEEINLSRAILSRVVDDRTSLLLADLGREGALTSESIVAMDIRSVIAVPLFDNERVRGVLYVDSQRNPAIYTEDDLQLITATANAVAVKLRNISMERELATAARIQKTMLPARLPEVEGFELHATVRMCREVGGDLYQVLPRSDGRLLLALGDVSGKGTPAALAMAGCMVLLSTLAELDDTVGALTARMHRQLHAMLAVDQFVTLFLAELDPATGRLDFVNAGHEPPILVACDGSLRKLGSCAAPVALLPQFDCRPESITLAPGELLAVFSDGIPEATLDGETFLGLEEVEAALVEHRDGPLVEVAGAIDEVVVDFLGGSHASDDISLLLLRREGRCDS